MRRNFARPLPAPIDPLWSRAQYRAVTSLPLVRVRLKHADADTFVQRFAPNVTRGGIFLASRDPRPVGVLVRFEVTLVNGIVMLAGQGRVAWVKPYDPAEPSRAHGMGVQFTELEPTSRVMLDRLLARKDGGSKSAPRPVPSPASGAVASPFASSASGERRVSEGSLTEFDNIEESALRRALDRARILAPSSGSLEELLASPAEQPAAKLDEALADLPRYFARGRGSGLFRLPPEPGQAANAPASPAAAVGVAASATPAVPALTAAPEEPTPVGEPTPMPMAESVAAAPEAPAAVPEPIPEQATRRFDSGDDDREPS
jgi:uncharacterized protein (TIGR02266 family)